MKTTTLFAPLAYISISNAAVSVSPGLLSEECLNLRFDNKTGWLVGDCSAVNGDSGSPRITSGTWLDNKIWNRNAVLEWNGCVREPYPGGCSFSGRFLESCINCILENGLPTLRCDCRPTSGFRRPAWLDLNKHIGVYSGHIFSNLTGAPVVPETPSKYPFPSTPKYAVNGNVTCVDPELPQPPPNGDYEWCNPQSHPNQCVDTAPNNTNNSWLVQNGPVNNCTVLWENNPAVFNELQLMAEGAWELTGYADAKCEKKLITISPDQRGACFDLGGKLVRAYTTRPLFNGDLN